MSTQAHLLSRGDWEKLFGLLLENVVADRAAYRGEPEVCRAAVAKLYGWACFQIQGSFPSIASWRLGRLCAFGDVPPPTTAEGGVDGPGRLYGTGFPGQVGLVPIGSICEKLTTGHCLLKVPSDVEDHVGLRRGARVVAPEG